MTEQTPRSDRVNVLIAGGGVAGLEAAFALNELAAERVAVTLLSAGQEFVYRPLSIGEAFSASRAEHYPLAPLAADAGATLISDTLTAVDPARRAVQTGGGAEIAYDVLFVGL